MRHLAIWMGLVGFAGCSGERAPIGATPARVSNAKDLGPVSRDAVFQFILGVKLRAPHALKKLLSEQPAQRRLLYAERFRYGIRRQRR